MWDNIRVKAANKPDYKSITVWLSNNTENELINELTSIVWMGTTAYLGGSLKIAKGDISLVMKAEIAAIKRIHRKRIKYLNEVADPIYSENMMLIIVVFISDILAVIKNEIYIN